MKFDAAALTEPPMRNSGSTVRAAPPMTLMTCPCACLSSGQNSLVRRTAPKNFSANPSSPKIVGKFEKISRPRRTRIVDQNVATAEAFLHAPECLLAPRKSAQVAHNGERTRPVRRNGIGSRVEVGLGRRCEHGLRAFARKHRGDGPPYAAAAARDEHDLAFELLLHLRPPCRTLFVIEPPLRSNPGITE